MSGGAIAVLVVLVWSMQPESAPQPAIAPAQQPVRQTAQTAPVPVPPVKLGALSAERDRPGEGSRNPFRYQPKVVPPPAKPVNVEPPPPTFAPPTKPIDPGPPPAPPIPLKFLGMLERANGVKWAVLSDGKNVLHGREGDIVDGRYRILKIGTESIELTHVDGRGRQVVRLTGQ